MSPPTPHHDLRLLVRWCGGCGGCGASWIFDGDGCRGSSS